MENLDDWAHFARVAEHGGFAAAERATGIPKSRLSRRLAELEQRLGARLVQRSTRRFALTPVGEQVLQHARAMLSEAEAARALVEEQANTPRGNVRLGCPPALLQAVINPMLVRFLTDCPQVRLEVVASNRNLDVWEAGVDLALRVRPVGVILPQEEIVRPLALSPHLFVATPELLGSGSVMSPRYAAALPALVLDASAGVQVLQLHDADGQSREITLTPRLVVNDMLALREAARAGLGCAVLPRLLIHDDLARGLLQEVLPGWRPPAWMVQAAYASRNSMRPVVRRLLDALIRDFVALIAEGRCLAAPERRSRSPE